MYWRNFKIFKKNQFFCFIFPFPNIFFFVFYFLFFRSYPEYDQEPEKNKNLNENSDVENEENQKEKNEKKENEKESYQRAMEGSGTRDSRINPGSWILNSMDTNINLKRSWESGSRSWTGNVGGERVRGGVVLFGDDEETENET